MTMDESWLAPGEIMDENKREKIGSVGLGYFLAFGGTGVMLMLRLPLAVWLGINVPVLPFVAAVGAAALCGGLKPGLLATALGTLGGTCLSIQQSPSWVLVAQFAFVGLLVSGLCEALHSARRRADAFAADTSQRRQQLEQQVFECRVAESIVRKQNERLRLLWEASSILLGHDDRDARLPALFAKVREHLEMDGASGHTRESFDRDEMEFLQTLSRYVSSAHERLRLIGELRDR
jgi:hypothetical protein